MSTNDKYEAAKGMCRRCGHLDHTHGQGCCNSLQSFECDTRGNVVNQTFCRCSGWEQIKPRPLQED